MTGNTSSQPQLRPSPVNDGCIIELKHITVERQRRLILDDINLTVNKGDFVAITGPNGGGKTTLLKIILKLMRPTSGSVSYYSNGTEADRLNIGYLPQKNMIDSHFPISVREVVASGLIAKRGLSDAMRHELISDTIRQVEMESHADAPIGQLSGGQLQRALLGRAIISSPSVLVLDEPLSYVDKHFEHHIYGLMEQLARDTTILLVSHEMSVIAGMANRHIIIDRTLHECHHTHHFAARTCDDVDDYTPD